MPIIPAMYDRLHRFAHYISLIVALAIIIIWAMTGSLFRFSDTWQFVTCTATMMSTLLVLLLTRKVKL